MTHDPTGDVQITVVIPAFNRPEALRTAVESAIDQDLPVNRYEVIVVDGSSNPRTAALIAELRRTSRCALRLVTKEPEGPGPSRNLGARLGSGAFIAFLDSDCQATPGWLRAGLAAFEPAVGLVEGRVLPDPKRPFTVFSHSLRIEQESLLYESANIFYRRAAFEAAGGFPPDLTPTASTPMGGEDVALAWNVKRLGWVSRFSADALVYHEIQPIPAWRWVYSRRLYIFPLLARQFPELRPLFFGGYFYDRAQAALSLALTGLIVAPFAPGALLLAAPYVLIRALEPTGTLRGPLRLVRVGAYFLKDVANWVTLIAGSVRYRRVLI